MFTCLLFFFTVITDESLQLQRIPPSIDAVGGCFILVGEGGSGGGGLTINQKVNIAVG